MNQVRQTHQEQLSIHEEGICFVHAYTELVRLAYDHGHLAYITTMTWLFKIDVDHINIKAFCEDFYVENVVMDTRNDRNEAFVNQITLKFTNISSKSIKIFKNGHVQITGVSSYFECMDISTMVLQWLNQFVPNNDGSRRHYEIKKNSQRIVMINICINTFSTQLIDMKDLSIRLKQNREVTRCTYNPENHRGLNIKFISGVSMFMFHTGNIIMSSHSLDDLKECYICVVQKHFIQEDRYRNQRPLSICKKYIENTCHGYDTKDLLACIVYTPASTSS